MRSKTGAERQWPWSHDKEEEHNEMHVDESPRVTGEGSGSGKSEQCLSKSPVRKAQSQTEIIIDQL
jgi:hypothetical protein